MDHTARSFPHPRHYHTHRWRAAGDFKGCRDKRYMSSVRHQVPLSKTRGAWETCQPGPTVRRNTLPPSSPSRALLEQPCPERKALLIWRKAARCVIESRSAIFLHQGVVKDVGLTRRSARREFQGGADQRPLRLYGAPEVSTANICPNDICNSRRCRREGGRCRPGLHSTIAGLVSTRHRVTMQSDG